MASSSSASRQGPVELRATDAQAGPIEKNVDPPFETYGPKTDSEYEALIDERDGLPT